MTMVLPREVTVEVTFRGVVAVLWSKVFDSDTVGEIICAIYSHICLSRSCLWSKNSRQNWTHVL